MSGLDNPQGEQANRPYIQFLFFSSLKVVNVKQTYDTCTLQKNKLIIIIIIIIIIIPRQYFIYLDYIWFRLAIGYDLLFHHAAKILNPNPKYYSE